MSPNGTMSAASPAARGRAARSCFQLAFQIRRGAAALEAGDRGGRIERERAVLLAGLVRVAGMAAAGRSDGGKTRPVAGIAFIVDERPGAIERRGAEVTGVPAHGVAGGVADAAIDALDGRVGGDAWRAVRPDPRHRFGASLRRREHAFRL